MRFWEASLWSGNLPGFFMGCGVGARNISSTRGGMAQIQKMICIFILHLYVLINKIDEKDVDLCSRCAVSTFL